MKFCSFPSWKPNKTTWSSVAFWLAKQIKQQQNMNGSHTGFRKFPITDMARGEFAVLHGGAVSVAQVLYLSPLTAYTALYSYGHEGSLETVTIISHLDLWWKFLCTFCPTKPTTLSGINTDLIRGQAWDCQLPAAGLAGCGYSAPYPVPVDGSWQHAPTCGPMCGRLWGSRSCWPRTEHHSPHEPLPCRQRQVWKMILLIKKKCLSQV